MNWWQGILSAGGGGGLVTLLVFILSRSEKASALAGTAITSMQGSLTMQEKLRTAMWQQSQALDAWESWGRRMQRAWDQLIALLEEHSDLQEGALPKMPPPPRDHPDLSKIFEGE